MESRFKRTKALLEITNRANSFVEDGYKIVFVSYNHPTYFAKLRHSTNGSVITLSANLDLNKFTQKKDNKNIIENQNIM